MALRRILPTTLLALFIATSPVEAASPGSATAGESASNHLRISATVVSVLDFRIDQAHYDLTSPAEYDFGEVVRPESGEAANEIAVDGALSWQLTSAPQRSIDIVMRDVRKVEEPAFGAMELDQLALGLTVERQAPGGSGVTTPMSPVSAGRRLAEDILVGSGPNSAEGNVNLKLEVRDDNAEGKNSWIVTLEAVSL